MYCVAAANGRLECNERIRSEGSVSHSLANRIVVGQPPSGDDVRVREGTDLDKHESCKVMKPEWMKLKHLSSINTTRPVLSLFEDCSV